MLKHKSYINLTLITLSVFLSGKLTARQSPDSLGKAGVPSEIENPECLGINKLPAHAVLMPYANLDEALAGKRHASSYAK
ncbi:MAG: hypothetical protein EOO07_36105, partial [Chitinophagaceae bacterium]